MCVRHRTHHQSEVSVPTQVKSGIKYHQMLKTVIFTPD